MVIEPMSVRMKGASMWGPTAFVVAYPEVACPHPGFYAQAVQFLQWQEWGLGRSDNSKHCVRKEGRGLRSAASLCKIVKLVECGHWNFQKD